MIKDRDIDLTVNSKFDGKEERNFQYRVKSCMEKLGIEKTNIKYSRRSSNYTLGNKRNT